MRWHPMARITPVTDDVVVHSVHCFFSMTPPIDRKWTWYVVTLRARHVFTKLR